MKQTIMGIGLIVGVLVGFVPSVDAQTQKKPVDIEACMSWKRVESPDISPTGRWVTYRIAPMEYNPENTDAKTVHLFDTRTRKEILLDDVENIEFYNSDQALSYQKADSKGIFPAGKWNSLFSLSDKRSERYGQSCPVF